MTDATSRARKCIAEALCDLFPCEQIPVDEAHIIIDSLDRSGFQIIDTRTHAAIPREPSDADVERVARAIDPGAWRVMDGYLADMLRAYRGENIGWPADQFRDAHSMEKARAAIAALVQTQTQGGERE